MNNKIIVEYIPPKNWRKRTKWRLVAPYVSHNNHVTVPIGFVTDGASVPWFVRWRFSPTGRYFPAAIVHDYLLVSLRDHKDVWKIANREFEEELDYLKINWFDKFVLLTIVKLWGSIKKFLGKKPRLIVDQ